MLKTEIKWPNHRRFKSRTEWEPIGFFSDCLCNATHFDLMLGFFSSSAINVLSYGFASFLYNGGKMRLIINNVLTTQDKEAIVNGCRHSIIKTYDLSDIHNIHETLSKRDKHFFECLSYLICKSRLDIVVIEPKDGLGISHTKTGVFYDNADKVAFDGSCNFSKTALIDNLESLTVSCSWDGAIECAKVEDIENIQKFFNNTASEKCGKMIYIIHLLENSNRESLNALLKFLEEPEDNVYAFITTYNEEKLLPTILSRAQHLKLLPLSRDKLLYECISNGISEDDAELLSVFYSDVDTIIEVANGENYIHIKD